ncbi:MAG: hypothetical protein RMJ18_02105 [Candidatus Aenigmarchaeota archaeon]|nr:cell division protein SepF [Candidatus Aenigmarchaeota archaeon]MCX8191097.1 cell division protein SepF [Candidatus Aenigmarchaeota archaeon]MDW8160189.1 hypothetical protein [Candidatus Aenigmarchaeota archaeon]
MALRDFLPRKKEEVGEEEIKVIDEERVKEEEKIKIKIEKLVKSEDVDKIIRFARQMVVIVKTQELQKKDFGYMQTLIEKLKRNCKQNKIDIVGTQDGYLILAPSFVEIARE